MFLLSSASICQEHIYEHKMKNHFCSFVRENQWVVREKTFYVAVYAAPNIRRKEWSGSSVWRQNIPVYRAS